MSKTPKRPVAKPPARAVAPTKTVGAPKPTGGKRDGKSGESKPVSAAKLSSADARIARAERSAERAAKKAADVAKAKAAAASAAFDAAEAREPRRYPKGGPSKADVKRLREKLLEMRRTLLSSSKELANEALKASGQDFSVDHMADHGSDNYEQDFSLKLLEGESEQLTDIREALMKIDGKLEPPFGICEACAAGEAKLCESCPWIPPSRLEVLPHARLCVQTKEIEERRKG